MTPHELVMYVEEYNERKQKEREEEITIAYYNAMWQRAKKMPTLKKVLNEIKPKKPQKPMTPEEMLAVVKQKHAAIEGRG